MSTDTLKEISETLKEINSSLQAIRETISPLNEAILNEDPIHISLKDKYIPVVVMTKELAETGGYL